MCCRLNAQSTEEELQYDAVLISLGARYQMYCSNISRTFLVDPNKQQEAQYKAILEAQDAAIAALKPGRPMSDAYEAAVKTLQASCTRLPSHLSLSFPTAHMLCSCA